MGGASIWLADSPLLSALIF